MNDHFIHIIKDATGAEAITELEEIQRLWSGYGRIARYALRGGSCDRIVVKHVKLPDQSRHPRGWDSDLSHQRKLTSYQVETQWYEQWSGRCNEACRVPRCLAYESHQDEVLIVLEDLDAAGFDQRRSSVSENELTACLKWLAQFHATFLGENPNGLWESGTYWHLETRPDELDVLDDFPLKQAAKAIDQKLKASPYQTVVHGDAKLANFCFTADGHGVAAVDFQYVGGGCGMKDLAYFIGSCLREDDCERLETELQNIYFTELKTALIAHDKPLDPENVEADWRVLYPVAWTDFHRFMKGWSPGHWKINSYSERLAREVVAQLKEGST
jgi:hypothetical protein